MEKIPGYVRKGSEDSPGDSHFRADTNFSSVVTEISGYFSGADVHAGSACLKQRWGGQHYCAGALLMGSGSICRVASQVIQAHRCRS